MIVLGQATPEPFFNETVVMLMCVVGIPFIALNFAAGLIWVERRLLAVWQERYGPNRVGPFGLLQPLADAIKLHFKEDWIPPFADKPVFVIAPGIVMATALLSCAVLPVAPGIGVIDDMNIALLFFLAMSSMGAYSVVLGGWASNNKYSLLGGLRSAAQMLSYEVFMGLSLMGVVVMTGTFSLREIVLAQEDMWFCIPQFFGMLIFLMAGLAETHRLPFDLPEAEASGKSNGRRWVSARPAIRKINMPRNCGMQNHMSCCASTIPRRLKVPVITTTPITERPMKTS